MSQSPSQNGLMLYSPIKDWTNDQVWLFLLQYANPWGHNNKDLLSMYSGATEDGECPVVLDTATPSCGNSRFGCWVCTLVTQDKSMAAMVKNDSEKEWMAPLLEWRDLIDYRGKDDQGRDKFRLDIENREFWRSKGNFLLHTKKSSGQVALTHGAYRQEVRGPVSHAAFGSTEDYAISGAN
jgi:DNA sulfur modification protein DndC